MRILNPTAAGGMIAYLTETITVDGPTLGDDRLSPLTRYFTSPGNPPGRWVGDGVAGLGLTADWTVSEAAMERLFQDGTHPVSGAALTSREYTKHVPLEERIAKETAALPNTLTADERAEAVAAIRAEQSEKRQRPSVSGFEMVFSPPKSFSVAWGLGDVTMKERLTAAHAAALQQTLEVMEEKYLRTRAGSAGVAQLTTRGVVAAKFDHWNSRALDPHLHTHVLIANRVHGVDGKWRTIDSRGALAPAVVTLSETYTTLLMDAVTRELGWEWANTTPGAVAKNQKWELDGVPAELVAGFSQRSTALVADKDALVEQFVRDRGRQPTSAEVLRMREMARRNTAPKKQVLSLSALTDLWATRATQLVPASKAGWLARLSSAAAAVDSMRRKTLWRADDISPARVQQLTDQVLATLGSERSTWRRHNAAAEVQRLLKGDRFASPADRQRLVDLTVEQIVRAAVPLTPPARFSAPVQFQTPDGRSAFTPAAAEVFTTADVLAAEARLLAATTETATTPTVPERIVDEVLQAHGQLDAGQAAAVAAVTTARRQLDVLVGPAGTGKTTTLRAVREAWEQAHGEGSIVGLAPSAVAADILGESIGISTENTAKWLFEHDRDPDQWSFQAEQLVIVDEAGLCGALALDRLREQAEVAGAKLLLVGDPHQLTAIDAGGAFGMLVRELGDDAATLESVWRFRNQWEATASLKLRHGNVAALNAYDEHERLHYGDESEILAGVFDAWTADEEAGLEALLIADAGETVAELNRRAQLWRIEHGHVDMSDSAQARGEQLVGRGDRVITRLNDRRLISSQGKFVKNGQRWTVLTCFTDGSIVLLSPEDGDTLTVGADYATSSVELAYAVTTHRAQGATVDTAHTVLTATGNREATYVAMTRGRDANHAWVIVDEPDGDDPTFSAPKTGREVLESIIATSSAEHSAHETRTSAARSASNIQRLAHEYETLAAAASAARWKAVLERDLTVDAIEAVTTSTAWDALAASLRELDAKGIPVEPALPQLVASRPFQAGDDPAAVVHFRLQQWAEGQRPLRLPERIVGIILRADYTAADTDMRGALDEREAAMLERASAMLDEAIAGDAAWLSKLTPTAVSEHRERLLTIAAYRDWYGVGDRDPRPLGDPPASTVSARADWSIAVSAWKNIVPTTTSSPTLTLNHDDEVPSARSPRPTR
jgi:conjugative relaxase-like TrwC/TraI family protein